MTAQPNDLITITQAAALRRKSGSPLSRNSIYVAIAAGKLKTFTLPVCGETLLVSQAEIEAYEAVGHKPAGYKHEKPLIEGETMAFYTCPYCDSTEETNLSAAYHACDRIKVQVKIDTLRTQNAELLAALEIGYSDLRGRLIQYAQSQFGEDYESAVKYVESGVPVLDQTRAAIAKAKEQS